MFCKFVVALAGGLMLSGVVLAQDVANAGGSQVETEYSDVPSSSAASKRHRIGYGRLTTTI